MKNTILITYDLHNPEQDYKKLINYLETLQMYQLQQSVWIGETSFSISLLKAQLAARIDKNDNVVITKISEIVGVGKPTVLNWKILLVRRNIASLTKQLEKYQT